VLLTQAADSLAVGLGRVPNIVLVGFLKEGHFGIMQLSKVLQLGREFVALLLQLAGELGSLFLFASVMG